MSKIAVRRDALPAPEVNVRNALAAYRVAMAAHALTVGVPAPLPQFDIVFELMKFDEFEVVDPPQDGVGDVTTFKQAVERMVTEFNAMQDELAQLKAEIETYRGEVATRNAQHLAVSQRLDLIDRRVEDLKVLAPKPPPPPSDLPLPPPIISLR